jgi:hypothetical protein
MKTKIKIISNWGDFGGSTTALINLTNLFNKNGYDAEFYTAQKSLVHLCNWKSEREFTPKNNDIIISHFIPLSERFPCKRLILSSHEHEVFPIKNINYKMYDKIHYVSEHQRKWHNIDHPFSVIPNVLDDLKTNNKPSIKIGGVIGSIDRNKQTHISIQKALDDGCDKVNLYGVVSDQQYFKESVSPLLSDKVIHKGYCNNKQFMWDSITDVYHYSKMETFGFILPEANMTNTLFHGNGSIQDDIEIRYTKCMEGNS